MAKFSKGMSGNPAGRPVGLERRLRELVEGDLDKLITMLRDIALGVIDAPPKDRITAARELLDRVMGKPRQAVDVTSDGPAMLLEALGLTAAQRAKRLADLEGREHGDDDTEDDDDDPVT